VFALFDPVINYVNTVICVFVLPDPVSFYWLTKILESSLKQKVN